MKEKNGFMIVLIIFLLVCSGLGVAAFIRSFTHKCCEKFKNTNLQKGSGITREVDHTGKNVVHIDYAKNMHQTIASQPGPGQKLGIHIMGNTGCASTATAFISLVASTEKNGQGVKYVRTYKQDNKNWPVYNSMVYVFVWTNTWHPVGKAPNRWPWAALYLTKRGKNKQNDWVLDIRMSGLPPPPPDTIDPESWSTPWDNGPKQDNGLPVLILDLITKDKQAYCNTGTFYGQPPEVFGCDTQQPVELQIRGVGDSNKSAWLGETCDPPRNTSYCVSENAQSSSVVQDLTVWQSWLRRWLAKQPLS